MNNSAATYFTAFQIGQRDAVETAATINANPFKSDAERSAWTRGFVRERAAQIVRMTRELEKLRRRAELSADLPLFLKPQAE